MVFEEGILMLLTNCTNNKWSMSKMRNYKQKNLNYLKSHYSERVNVLE